MSISIGKLDHTLTWSSAKCHCLYGERLLQLGHLGIDLSNT